MANHAATDYFMDLSLVDDPYPFFEQLRAQGPVVPLPLHGVVAVTGYDEALSVYLDTEHYSAANAVTGPLPPLPFAPAPQEDITERIEAHRPQIPFGEDVLTLDAPRHTPPRSLMMRLFTPRRLREIESYVARLADQLLDEIAADGTCEFIGQYSSPFGALVIADLLGVPAEDRDEFRQRLGTSPSQVGADARAIVNPFEFRRDKLLAYITERRREPRSDILSELANATFPDGSLPQPLEVVRVASLLFGAGQDTTAHLLSACLRVLGEWPEWQERLRAEPAGIPDFIEEVLRFSGPVKATFRLARKPTTLAGVPVPAGTHVMLATAALNRDPRRFDEPGAFRPGRAHAREHLAFGRGTHTCPGAALARAETRISLERMLARFSHIALDPAHHGEAGAHHFRYAPSYVFRALAGLHLRLS